MSVNQTSASEKNPQITLNSNIILLTNIDRSNQLFRGTTETNVFAISINPSDDCFNVVFIHFHFILLVL